MENGRIYELNKQIKNLKKEKEEIQSNCTHKKTHAKFVEGTNTMRLFCKDCESMLGFPSQEQIDEFLKNKKDEL